MNSKEEYCNKYYVPEDYFWEILEDSKVIPMIRGKATEYSAYLFLKANLDEHKFSVEKLNLNAQSGVEDEDISITHRMTGKRLRVEVKNACRASFSDGKGCRVMKDIPHFKVKCHRSRSNMDKASTTNDRYVIGDFDLLVTNTLNSIYEGGTYMSDFRLISAQKLASIKEFYKVSSSKELQDKCSQDWRFAFPENIAERHNGILAIPRTPCVALYGDTNWFSIKELSDRLEQKAISLIEEERKQKRSKRLKV